jgi:hypothetical protein
MCRRSFGLAGGWVDRVEALDDVVLDLIDHGATSEQCDPCRTRDEPDFVS